MSTQRGDTSARRGFTLMELLVVMAIITLLATLLFPVLAQARERARRIACLSQLQQISRAHLLYLDDWDEELPDWRYPARPRTEVAEGFVYWIEYLQPYLRHRAITHDPSAAEPPPPPGEGIRLADYALMTWGPSGFGIAESPHFRWPGPPLSLAQVGRPGETISLMDGYTATKITWGFVTRHQHGVNAAFLDGHARWLALRELYRVDTDGRGFYWHRYAAADR
jgi:prepilin-type N-terminal cleavage/methylation domain-containing protein/prepilin-type processing-associated H-X9-DG protein